MHIQRMAIVCFEDPRCANGGVQRRIAAEIAYFTRRNVEIIVISAGIGSHERNGSVTYITVPTPDVAYPMRTLCFSARASHYLRHIPAIDLIETHHDAGAAALLADIGGRSQPSVWVQFVHGVFRDEFTAVLRYEGLLSRATLTASGLLPLSLIEQAASRRANAVVTVSAYAAKQIATRYGVASQNIHILPNGIDTRCYTPYTDVIRQKASNIADICTILYVGRFHARKGIIYLVRAFASAYRTNQRLRLELIGSGVLESMLREESARLGVDHVLTFLGALDDESIIKAYRKAHIVCVPSLQEGQGIVALEAQACGVPVVATCAGGLVEAVRDRRTGILVPAGDSTALADALLELANDTKLRLEYSQNAVIWAHSFSWDTMIAKAETLYGTLQQAQAFI